MIAALGKKRQTDNSFGNQPAVRRALVIRLGGIGDVILATPMMRLLKDRYPSVQIDVLVQKGFADAASGMPYVDRVHELDKKIDFGMVWRLLQTSLEMRHARYDLLLNLQPSLKTYLVAAFAAAPVCLTFRKDRSIQPETGRVRHAIDDFVKTLAPLGICASVDRRLDFYVPEEARASLGRMLIEHGVDAERPLIVLNPTATRRVNRWPAESWAGLIDELADAADARAIVVVGGKRDAAVVRAVQRRSRLWGRVVDLSGSISLKELGALFERATVVVTADTGPMHIAAAVGAPIVCLSGAADPNRTGPLTPLSQVIIDRSLSCVSCGRKRCVHGRNPKCMSLIGTDQVAGACRRQIASNGDRSGTVAAAV